MAIMCVKKFAMAFNVLFFLAIFTTFVVADPDTTTPISDSTDSIIDSLIELSTPNSQKSMDTFFNAIRDILGNIIEEENGESNSNKSLPQVLDSDFSFFPLGFLDLFPFSTTLSNLLNSIDFTSSLQTKHIDSFIDELNKVCIITVDVSSLSLSSDLNIVAEGNIITVTNTGTSENMSSENENGVSFLSSFISKINFTIDQNCDTSTNLGRATLNNNQLSIKFPLNMKTDALTTENTEKTEQSSSVGLTTTESKDTKTNNDLISTKVETDSNTIKSKTPGKPRVKVPLYSLEEF